MRTLQQKINRILLNIDGERRKEHARARKSFICAEEYESSIYAGKFLFAISFGFFPFFIIVSIVGVVGGVFFFFSCFSRHSSVCACLCVCALLSFRFMVFACALCLNVEVSENQPSFWRKFTKWKYTLNGTREARIIHATLMQIYFRVLYLYTHTLSFSLFFVLSNKRGFLFHFSFGLNSSRRFFIHLFSSNFARIMQSGNRYQYILLLLCR